jgi:membrane associated rhomboid family serine protease
MSKTPWATFVPDLLFRLCRSRRIRPRPAAPGFRNPLIGASGAVAGIVAAYLMLHPKVRVWVLVLGRIPLPLPAFIPLLFWVLFQFFMVVTDIGGEVSWAAHVGGIIAVRFWSWYSAAPACRCSIAGWKAPAP